MPWSRERLREYQQTDEWKAVKKAYRETHKEEISEYNKEYQRGYKERPGVREKARAATAKRRKEKPDEVLASNLDWKRRKRKSDPAYRMKESLRARFNMMVRGKSKNGSAVRDLGCTWQAFIDRIESRLQPGWSWENYGTEWQIDHIFPLAWVNLEDRLEVRAACHYLNLRPISAADNIAKGDSLSAKAQYLFDGIKRMLLRQDEQS